MASTAHTENRSRQENKMPELLAPAGSFEKMVTAIHYGANAVYCGGKRFSLRAHASNFSEKELAEAVEYAHAKNVKLYVTVNIFAHQKDLQGLDKYLQYLQVIGVDGIIISDPGILTLAKETIPEVPIHLSTQANVTNPANAKFWEGQGAKRLNLARELSLSEITGIRKALQPTTQIEIFVHGALCISYSGRCLLSSYFTGRDANRGECAHPCRYNYVLQEEKRPGQYFPVEEDNYGTYIFNSKDLCLLNKLPLLINCGINSLKIEGRMKSIHYVGAVVRVYRAAIDYIGAHIEEALTNNNTITLPPVYMEELMKVGTRGYTDNFIFGPPGAEDMLYDRPRSDQSYVPVGIIQGAGNKTHVPNSFEIKMMSPLRKGETVEYLSRNINPVPITVTELLDQDGSSLEQANPGSIVRVTYDPEFSIALEENYLLRKKNNP